MALLVALTVRNYLPSGGMTLAGTAAVQVVKVYTPTGGLTFGGAAAVQVIKTYVGSGGLTFGGKAPVQFIAAFVPTGGLVFGGAAATAFIPGAAGNIFTYVGSGGLTLGGSALTSLVSGLSWMTGLGGGGPWPPFYVITYPQQQPRPQYADVPEWNVYTYVGSGGMRFGGSARVRFVPMLPARFILRRLHPQPVRRPIVISEIVYRPRRREVVSPLPVVRVRSPRQLREEEELLLLVL